MASNVLGFLNDKNILVSGSTGFLGKIFLEKILRTQPGIKRIFVLLRAKDVASARLRFKNEVMKLELFKTLREQYGDKFESFVFQKVVPLVGDIAADDSLGIDSESTREYLWENLDAIVNNAASTVLDDRYDISLNVNAKGAKNIVEFAKRCRKLQILLHVSTAYVAGRGSGKITERPVKILETVTTDNGSEDESGTPLRLDIEEEFGLIEKTVAMIHMNSSTTTTESKGSVKDTEAEHLIELGLKRARSFGWPNTYSFTKAMGEMLVEKARGNLPVVIIRPSIIESTLAEPFPGWIEGSRTIDTLIVRYGRGRMSSFLADPDLILDVIPADLVVNAMIVAMATHACEKGLFIYHSASSVGNPLLYPVVRDEAYKYFSQHPCLDKEGNVIHVKEFPFLKSMESFRRYMNLYYKAPLQVVGAVNKILCYIMMFTERYNMNFTERYNMNFTERYNEMLRNYNKVMYLAELYEPYAFFQGRFDITNTEGLLSKISEEDRMAFNFDVKCIDWPHYYSKIHIPGLVKYVLK